MTEADLAALDAAERAATPGPWEVSPLKDNSDRAYPTSYQAWVFVDPAVCGLWAKEGTDLRDAAFIALARNAMPSLLAELARLRAERDEARAAIASLRSRLADLEQSAAAREAKLRDVLTENRRLAAGPMSPDVELSGR